MTFFRINKVKVKKSSSNNNSKNQIQINRIFLFVGALLNPLKSFWPDSEWNLLYVEWQEVSQFVYPLFLDAFWYCILCTLCGWKVLHLCRFKLSPNTDAYVYIDKTHTYTHTNKQTQLYSGSHMTLSAFSVSGLVCHKGCCIICVDGMYACKEEFFLENVCGNVLTFPEIIFICCWHFSVTKKFKLILLFCWYLVRKLIAEALRKKSLIMKDITNLSVIF